jgi:glycosyltransferase involved in cell wall biosynthesis
LKCCLLTPNLQLGGAELWCAWLTRHCKVDWQGICCINNREPHPLVMQSVRAPVVRGDIAAAILASKCDVVIAWGCGESLRMIVAGANAIQASLKRKVVFVSHGSVPWGQQHVSPVLETATHLAAVSQPAARIFGDREVTVIHNGVCTERLAQTIDRDTLRAEWGLHSKHIVLGYVGRLSPEKNPLAAVHAARTLGGNYRAVLVGNVSPQSGRRWQALLPRIGGDAVIVPARRDVGNVLRAMDCFVLASPAEGFSLAIIEAWLCGCPVVCTPVGAIPELHGLYGQMAVTVPVGATGDVLAGAVRRAVSAENRETVERAKAVALAEFTAEKMGARWRACLERIAQF